MSLLIVYFVTLRPVFPFCLAQFVQVFLLKPASFCKLSAGLDSTNKTFIFLFLFFNSCSVLVTLSSPPSFLFTSISLADLTATSLSFCPIGLQWVAGHSFLSGNDAANVLARRGALLSAVPCSFSPFIFRIHSSLFSNWRCTVLF